MSGPPQPPGGAGASDEQACTALSHVPWSTPGCEMGFARQVANTVCFLDGGRIVESGTPEQVLSEPQQDRTRQFLRRVTGAGRL
jgi:ABC-type antimicrobial peptide transport system ATPase subunit